MGRSNTPYDAAAICHAVSQIQLSVRDFIPTNVRDAVAILDDVFETLWKLKENLNQRPEASKATKNMLHLHREAQSQSTSTSPTYPGDPDHGLASTDIKQVVGEFFATLSTFPTTRPKVYGSSSEINAIAQALNLDITPNIRDTLEYLSEHIHQPSPTRNVNQAYPLASIAERFGTGNATPTSIRVNQPAISKAPAMKPQSYSDGLEDPDGLEEDEDEEDEEDEEEDDEDEEDEELSDPSTEREQGSHKELDNAAPRQNMTSGGDFTGNSSSFTQTLSSLTKDPPPPRKMKGIGDCEKIIAYAQRHPENQKAQEQSQIAEKKIVIIHEKRKRQREKEKEARKKLYKYPVQFRGELRTAQKNDRRNERYSKKLARF